MAAEFDLVVRGGTVIDGTGAEPREADVALRDGKVAAVGGVSGAGRAKFALDYHFSEINESVSAYKLAGTHRHTPEIEMALGVASGQSNLAISFTPHLIPMTRGILAAAYADLQATASAADLVALATRAESGDIEELDSLFQPFHGTFARGSGLGLAIVAGIQRLHGGRSLLQRERGKVGELLDRDVLEAVFLRELDHHVAFAKMTVVLLRVPDALIRHEFEQMVHRPLARDFVDDRGHLLLREQRAIFLFLCGNRGYEGRETEQRDERDAFHACLLQMVRRNLTAPRDLPGGLWL